VDPASDDDDDDDGSDERGIARMNAAKIDALFPMNPKVQAAGFWGSTVFLHLVLLNRAHRCQGLVPVRYCAPEYLAKYIGLGDAEHLGAHPVALARVGLQRAQRAGLIAIEPDGVRLTGWAREWSQSESAERTRKWRSRTLPVGSTSVSRPSLELARDLGVDPDAHLTAELEDSATDDRRPRRSTIGSVTSRDARDVTTGGAPPFPSPLVSPSLPPPSYSPPLPSPFRSPSLSPLDPLGRL
jgi:hypothetical protein